MNLESENKNEINLSTRQDSERDEKFAKPPSPKRLVSGLDELSDLENEVEVLTKPSTEISVNHEPDDEKIDVLDFDDDDDDYFLVSSDNKKFQVTKNAIELSVLAQTALSGDDSSREIPIPLVNSEIMEYVVRYLTYHDDNPVVENNTPEKLSSGVFSEQVKCEWDVKFIDGVMSDPNTAKTRLYALIQAANFMDIKPLLQLACTKVASMIKGESLDAIKKIISPDVPYVDNHQSKS